jgi:hypothetical protein
MDFIKKHTLSVSKIESLKLTQKRLSSEMKLANEYKEDLIIKMFSADRAISEKQKQAQLNTVEISDEISKMKTEFDSCINSIESN